MTKPSPFSLAGPSQAASEYLGPYFQYNGRLNVQWAVYLTEIKSACLDYFLAHDIPTNERSMNTAHMNCVLNNLSMQQQSNSQSHDYVVTLWPALISLIVAAGPDPSHAAYDNVAWAFILALTCGGALGYEDHMKQPHVMETEDAEEARRLCETLDPIMPHGRKLARYSPKRGKLPRRWTHIMSLLVLLSLLLWIGMVSAWAYTFNHSFLVSAVNFTSSDSLIWYLLAPVFAFGHAAIRLYLNNVEIYVPMVTNNHQQAGDTDEPSFSTLRAPSISIPEQRATLTIPLETLKPRLSSKQSSDSVTRSRLTVHVYEQVPTTNGWTTWLQIARLQLTSKPYRIVVHPWPENYVFGAWGFVEGLFRSCGIAWGCAAMSASILPPFPWDFYSLAFLITATAVPRILWSKIQKLDSRGADLIVYVHPLTGWS